MGLKAKTQAWATSCKESLQYSKCNPWGCNGSFTEPTAFEQHLWVCFTLDWVLKLSSSTPKQREANDQNADKMKEKRLLAIGQTSL